MEQAAYLDTKIGIVKITQCGNSIARIEKIDGSCPNLSCETTPLLEKAICQIEEYLDGKRRVFELPLVFNGTAFQNKVWQALCDIPYGETRSYKQLAQAVGNPKACRAVGMANNKNPLLIVVPCHRVIGADGRLVGYAAGLEIKQQLLEMEKLEPAFL